MIYQHVNKRTGMLSLATSHIAHYATCWIMLHCQILCHVSKALCFIKIALKLRYFCKKMQNFRALGASKFKNKLRKNETENWQKNKSSQLQLKSYQLLHKKRVWLHIIYPLVSGQPGRRQDSVTGRAQINLGGHEKFIYVNSRGVRRHEKFIPV